MTVGARYGEAAELAAAGADRRLQAFGPLVGGGRGEGGGDGLVQGGGRTAEHLVQVAGLGLQFAGADLAVEPAHGAVRLVGCFAVGHRDAGDLGEGPGELGVGPPGAGEVVAAAQVSLAGQHVGGGLGEVGP
ncbi:hypothetical protein OHA77_38930 [Streptosporangium sp. NBC_01639]|uniref:hypothetical protein n=1 Tax=Streptosporangium sp. NBC_01639 TaxID=2975948 RepID=UPI003869F5D1|nr:hypothetical protein OHA77_38930 [Streptosporangium sp. NBC_01639]